MNLEKSLSGGALVNESFFGRSKVNFNSLDNFKKNRRRNDFRKKRGFFSKEIERRRRTKVTKGGRRFSVSSLVLFRNEDNNSLGFGYAKGKEPIIAFRKSLKLAQKKSLNYFPNKPRTISRDIIFEYKAVKILLKPAAPGSGLKAGGVLRDLFNILGISDITAKIISRSKNRNSIIRASFMIFDKLTKKKYDY